MKETVTIGVTDCSKYDAYARWIEQEPGIKVIRLSHKDNNAEDVLRCDGVLLTGGEDVHPRYYKREDYLPYCEFDEKRDAFEWKVMEFTEKKGGMPILGICRGLQLANVFYGGTLIPHIPAFGKFDHVEKSEADDRYHSVLVDPNSELGRILGVHTGEINSAHHQCADRVAPGLVANAVSPDGVVEGLERESEKKGPFLQLVQWHPERMIDPNNVFSRNVRIAFVEACRSTT